MTFCIGNVDENGQTFCAIRTGVGFPTPVLICEVYANLGLTPYAFSSRLSWQRNTSITIRPIKGMK